MVSLMGEEDTFVRLPTMNRQQQNVFRQFNKQLQGMMPGANQAFSQLQQYMDPNSDIWKQFEDPYKMQFEQETVPMLAERFAGLGGGLGGGLSSSGFGQSLGAAGSQLSTNLAGMKANMQRQSIMDLLNQFNQMAGLGLGTQSFAYGHQPASPGFLPTMAGAAVGGFAQGAGQGFANR